MKANGVVIRKTEMAVLAVLCALAVAQGQAVAANSLVDRGNGIVEEVPAGRMWAKQRSFSIRSPEEAQAYAERLGLGGYTDWRLPTPQELYDLHYLVDIKKAKGIAMKMEGNYWLVDQEGTGMAGSWEVGDQCEPSRSYFKKEWGYVRAVRP